MGPVMTDRHQKPPAGSAEHEHRDNDITTTVGWAFLDNYGIVYDWIVVIIIIIIALCREVVAMAEDEEDEEQLVHDIIVRESWRLYHRRTSADDDAQILDRACPTRVILLLYYLTHPKIINLSHANRASYYYVSEYARNLII